MIHFIENAISAVSPKWGMRREACRFQTARIRAAFDDDGNSLRRAIFGNMKNGGYEAGRSDRIHGRIIGSPHENDIPSRQIAALRYRSWNLYRNCPQARKIVRTLDAKVIGRGLSPQPQSTNKDETAFVEFRKRAREVFAEFCKESDFRGKPGAGGQDFAGQCRTALHSCELSGGALYRFHRIDRKEQRDRELFVPLQLQLIHIDRLDETKSEKNVFRGIKVDDLGRVVGCWVKQGGVNASEESIFIGIGELRHFYVQDDIDQFLGSPWFGAALLTMDDRRNYENSEIIAAEAAACVVGTYRLSPGQGGFGLQTSDTNSDLTDVDGNPVTRLQPMMMLNLGSAGEFEIKGSDRPNSSASEFLSHLMRGEAASVPGVKSSTLTMDYRNSSFSSERSADNDIWPELETVQDWLALGFCQPIYEECIKAAVLSGLFDKVPGFSAADFEVRKREYLKTTWQGPVCRSINPKDDALAARERIKNGSSSPQREAAKLAADWREILQEDHEYIEFAQSLDIPDDVWQNGLGIEQIDKITTTDPEATGDPKPTEAAQDAAFHNRINGSHLLNSA